MQHQIRHQHPAAARHHHQDYHAAALAADEQQQWHSSNSSSSNSRHQQHNRPQGNVQQQTWHAVRELMQPPATAMASAERPHTAPSQPGTSTSSSVRSSSPQTGAIGLVDAAESSLPGGEGEAQYGVSDVFLLSSPQEQYKRTLEALRSGQSKNLDQLAHMFDPQALLAGKATVGGTSRLCQLLLCS